MEHLKRAHPYSRIAANVVYNEYIQDRWAAGDARAAWSMQLALAQHPFMWSTAGVARTSATCT